MYLYRSVSSNDIKNEASVSVISIICNIGCTLACLVPCLHNKLTDRYPCQQHQGTGGQEIWVISPKKFLRTKLIAFMHFTISPSPHKRKKNKNFTPSEGYIATLWHLMQLRAWSLDSPVWGSLSLSFTLYQVNYDLV